MPFVGLARVHSQEQAALGLSTRPAPTAPAAIPLTPVVSSHSSRTADVEAQAEELKEGKEVSGKEPTGEDAFEVAFTNGREGLHPHTWSPRYRWCLTAFAGLLVLNSTFSSSAPSNLIPAIIAHYNTSQEIGILLISIFVLGYVFGPLLWGPLSERYGRKNIFLVAFAPYVGFQIGCALSPNVGALLVFRFLGGVFASSPLTNSGGVIADMWGPKERGNALAIFSLAPFLGPAIGPIVSGYMAVTDTYFAWIFWVLTIFAGLCLVAIVFFLPETYGPYILYKEAKRLRKETGDDRWHCAMDDTSKEPQGLMAVLERTVFKPFLMIVQEPMLLALTVYMSLTYGVVYLLFVSVPIIFIGGHGLNPGEAGLVFLALPIGGLIAVLSYVYYFNVKYVEEAEKTAPTPVAPEFRLIPLLYAAPLFAVSFFWLGGTSATSISIASPILAITLLGACVLFIFLACFNYLIDTYLANAASALAINTVARSTFGAGFPLFGGQMYTKLGTLGASFLLGGLAILCVPIPFLLMKYGRKLRGMSKHAVVRAHE